MNLLDDLHVHAPVSSPEREPLHRRERRTRCAAILVVATAITSTWLLSGVAINEAVRFASFEAFYVLLPGFLLYTLLSVEPGGWLRTVAVGVPLGYAINTGAFALTAALDVRAAFAFLPLVALGVIGPILMCRSKWASPRTLYRGVRDRDRVLARGECSDHGQTDRARAQIKRRADAQAQIKCRDDAGKRSVGGLDALLVASAITAALVLLALTFFASSPLPAQAHSVVYSADNVFDISLAAEARNHWPITAPWVAGQSLRYYTGVFIHAAAINQVVGVPLSTVFLRLLPTMMFLVVAMQLWFLGSSLRRSHWVGPLAVVLLLVVEDLNLNPTQSQVFHINPFTQFPQSPSFAFGAPFLLGVLALLGPRFAEVSAPSAVDGDRRGVTSAGAVGTFAILAILVVGAATAKTFAAADLVGGLGFYWLWSLIARRPSRLALYCLALSVICVAVVYFTTLAGGGASSMSLAPFNFVQEGNSFVRARTLAEGMVGHSLYWLPLLLGAGIFAVCLFAPLLGGVWLLRRRSAISAAGGLAGAVFVTGALAYLLLGAPGGVEGVFLVYGYIAVVPLAAAGLLRLWEDTPPDARLRLGRACAGLLALGLAIAGVTPALALAGREADAWYALVYGCVAGGIALTIFRLRIYYVATISSRVGRTVACAIPLLVVLGLVKPTALAASGAWKTITRQRIAPTDSASHYGLTSSLYTGLIWVRDHTSRCDVLAVSNHFSGPGGVEPDYVYYSAFTERRIFLESWLYTPAGTLGREPFPGRLALNNLAVSGSPKALRELALDGVSYVLIDKRHGGGAPEPPSVSRLVFENSALDVYRLFAPRDSARPRCATVT